MAMVGVAIMHPPIPTPQVAGSRRPHSPQPMTTAVATAIIVAASLE